MRLFILLMILTLSAPVIGAPIKISNVSSLDFGVGIPGDVAKVIAPGTAENSSNASFQVTGDANTAYTITLPIAETMTTSGGNQANRKINISNFLSFPSEGANGLLGPSGSQMLFLGASRASLLPDQVAGSYSGTIRITVVY